MNEHTPKISIITICYNTEKTIEKTIQSVLGQDYPNIEYLIIDGKSTDSTMDIVNKYKDDIAVIVSEKDKGIFDAMNKGMQKATGDYVWYIHADDHIYASDTLSLAMQNHGNEDFIYGKSMMVSEEGVERSLEERKAHPDAKTLTWKSFRDGMVVGHQSMIVKRSVSPLYNTKYNLVGDLDWAINILKKSTSVRDTGVFLCRFVEGGISTQHRKASLKQRFVILKAHFGLIPTVWQHFLITLKAIKRGSMR